MDDVTKAGLRAEPEIVRRLTDLGRAVPPPEIAEIWVFPPLESVEASAEFLLFTRYLDEHHRRVYSARMVPPNGHPARQVVVEHGCVPADRVPRLVGDMQRRLGEERQPIHLEIGGRPERWRTLVEEPEGD